MAYKKERNLKVCYKSETRKGHGWYGSGTEYISVPSINLKGKWLGEIGFNIDTPIKVECKKGKIVITPIEL